MFQIFVKPVGAVCNLNCRYCYYLNKGENDPGTHSFRMPQVVLEEYIVQHIEACTESTIRFSWHGGEPTLAGLDFYERVVSLQQKYQPPNQVILNGIMTNGTLLNEDWCRFLAEHGFFVGLSLDGPREFHDRYRADGKGDGTFAATLSGYDLLRRFDVSTDVLCVVNDQNVQSPQEVYSFFKEIGAAYISFLPLVEQMPGMNEGVSPRSVPAEAFGRFLCTIFNLWQGGDIGRIKVQIFEEALKSAFTLEHALCIFRPTCGQIPVVEHNGDFYCCDHYVNKDHLVGNIIDVPLERLLSSPQQQAFGQAKLNTLPSDCLECEVREMCNGGCPKNRILQTASGEKGLNYLCEGYKMFFTHCRPFVRKVAAAHRGCSQ